MTTPNDHIAAGDLNHPTPAAAGMSISERVDPAKLSFDDIPGSMDFLRSIPGLPVAAQCALNLALLDGAAKRAGKPVYDRVGASLIADNKAVLKDVIEKLLAK